MGIAKDWSNLDCHFGLAMAYLGLQDPIRAKKSLEDVLRIDPKNKKAVEILQQVENAMQQTTAMNIQIQGGTGNANLSVRSRKS